MSGWTADRPTVGQSAERSRDVTSDDIKLFTAISGDHNPLHYDSDAAAKSRFGAVIVQGGIITAILNAVVAEDLPGPGSVFLHVDWNFRAPAYPGDTITGGVEVLDVRHDKPIVTLATTVRNQRGEVVLDGTALTWTEPI